MAVAGGTEKLLKGLAMKENVQLASCGTVFRKSSRASKDIAAVQKEYRKIFINESAGHRTFFRHALFIRSLIEQGSDLVEASEVRSKSVKEREGFKCILVICEKCRKQGVIHFAGEHYIELRCFSECVCNLFTQFPCTFLEKLLAVIGIILSKIRSLKSLKPCKFKSVKSFIDECFVILISKSLDLFCFIRPDLVFLEDAAGLDLPERIALRYEPEPQGL